MKGTERESKRERGIESPRRSRYSSQLIAMQMPSKTATKNGVKKGNVTWAKGKEKAHLLATC